MEGLFSLLFFAALIYLMMHSGRLGRLCPRNCLDAFESGPERYTGTSKEVAR